ncbi:MAG: release factor glutamine methyltransferase [Acidimicrobiaceae bacterium]|jgi:release factor glutamine methyltransferase
MRSCTTNRPGGCLIQVSDPPTWRRLLGEAADLLGDRTDARRIVEEASGYEGAELTVHLDGPANALTLAQFDAMVERRAAGEPLQYVLGRWGFRSLDVFVDKRVLIPRPETEVVVEHALAMVDTLGARVAVDLGTGSGVIALSLAVERSQLSVWATDASDSALDVARANLAGIGRAATRVRLGKGDWFTALPQELAGTIDVVVANPPYVAAHDELPPEVANWEPHEALIAGPTGLEAVERIVRDAPEWLQPHGAVVLEIGETQAERALELCADYAQAEVRTDLAGRPRVLVAVR